MSIRVLDPSVADLIAAGEVVERPASVVKELVENSLDAGATHILIEIVNGGRELIRVTDDGCGIGREEALTAFQKHATSKICDKDDLFRICTLGFRGEALPSVAAVSKVSLLTKTHEALTGQSVCVEGGRLTENEEAPASDGTVVTVRDLFYNTPARLKFMKSDASESGAITDLIGRLAISHPSVSFSLSVNGKDTLFSPGNGQLSDAVFAVHGKEFLSGLLPVERTTGSVRVYGYTCKPIFGRSGRKDQIFFVNGRTVKSKLLQTVLESAYRNSMMVSRFPYAVLFVELDPSSVDINVHPGKLEVKFSDDKAVGQAVLCAVQSALSFENGIEPIRFPESEPLPPVKPPVREEKKNVPEPTPVKKVEVEKEVVDSWTILTPKTETGTPSEPLPYSSLTTLSDLSETKTLSLNDKVADVIPPEPKSCFVPEQEPIESDPLPETDMADDFLVVGEVYNAYIIVQKEEEILFIDKHALHERMNFEDLKTREIPTQMLLAPVSVDVGREDKAVILEHLSVLKEAGFDVEDFGDDLVVREIPMLLPSDHIETALNEFATLLRVGHSRIDPLDEILHTVACKAAIKSGTKTSPEEDRQLIGRYFRNKDKLKYCPHGRPIAFSLERSDIEKKFKRIE